MVIPSESPVSKICLNTGAFKTPQKSSSVASGDAVTDMTHITTELINELDKVNNLPDNAKASTLRTLLTKVTSEARSKFTVSLATKQPTAVLATKTKLPLIKPTEKSALITEHCKALDVKIDLLKPSLILLAAIELDKCRQGGALWQPCTLVARQRFRRGRSSAGIRRDN